MSSGPERVLIAAEEPSLRSDLRRTLEVLGFEVGEAQDSEIAMTRLRMVDYEAILLDFPVFGAASIAVCHQLRGIYPRLPILILSACDCLDNKVDALEAGADDYMIQPISERELSARLRSAIRRLHAPTVGITERFVVGNIVLDSCRRRVEKSGSEVSLTPIEFRTLQMLMQQAGTPVTYAALLASLWGQESKQHREHLRVIISALRKKLEDSPSRPNYLITHNYFGYCFRDNK
jgi:two-component system, OmpR family, KDP operon response regulator KdpE